MPQVSIIIPCFNEQKTIQLLLDALYTQTYPREKTEIILADGMSSDGTRDEIKSWQDSHTDMALRVVDNPKRVIPAALNTALEVARGEFIVRLDAHSIPARDYVERSIDALQQGFGENVGGIWQIKPGAAGWVARSIAAAASHPLAVGGAHYRVGGQPQAVDTVPFGAFHRVLVDRIGHYNEALLSNEDYEFNARIRKDGGIVWFDPKIQSTYYARSNLRDLAKQYWRYGFWKYQMVRNYPDTIRLRQLLPFLLVLFFCCFGFLSFWFQFTRWFLMIGALIYSFTLFIASLDLSTKHRKPFRLLGVPLALVTMHFSWGTGFLWSLLKTIFRGI